MSRPRIGKKQQAMLDQLALVGPIEWDTLDWQDQRRAQSLKAQGHVRITTAPLEEGGPLTAPRIELVSP